MGKYIVIAIVVIILVAAIAYMIKAKKNGARCIGCPSGGCNCDSKSKEGESCCCGCSQDKES